IVLFATPSILSAGQCGYVMPGSGVTSGIAQINFAVRGSGSLDQAIGIWRDGCWGMGDAYPSMTSSSDFLPGPGIVNLNVFFTSGTSPNGRCGSSDIFYAPNGTLTGGNIFIYQYQMVNGQQVACQGLQNYDALVAHELGHALGLYDSYLANP